MRTTLQICIRTGPAPISIPPADRLALWKRNALQIETRQRSAKAAALSGSAAGSRCEAGHFTTVQNGTASNHLATRVYSSGPAAASPMLSRPWRRRGRSATQGAAPHVGERPPLVCWGAAGSIVAGKGLRKAAGIEADSQVKSDAESSTAAGRSR